MTHITLIFFSFVLGGLLISLSYIDLKQFRLPNALTFPLIAAGFGQAYLLGLPLQDHIIGAALGYLAFVAIEQGFLKLRGYPGLGRGDAKLLAGGGAWVGWFGLPYIVLLSSLAGLSVCLSGCCLEALGKGSLKKRPYPSAPF